MTITYYDVAGFARPCHQLRQADPRRGAARLAANHLVTLVTRCY